MIVDRRKDSYDELMMLSRDSKLERNRKSQWTTGIVATAVVASGIYIGGTNEHLGDLATALDAAESGLQTAKNAHETETAELNNRLQALQAQLAILEKERDFTRQNQEWFRSLALAIGANDNVVKVVERIGPTPDTTSQTTLANVVWVVDGARRFPMAAGDILWVPEGSFWVRLESPDGSRPKPHKISIFTGSQVIASSTPDTSVDFYAGRNNPYAGKFDRSIPASAGRGTSTCVRLTLHKVSSRPGFSDSKFVDMEVSYHASTIQDPCESN